MPKLPKMSKMPKIKDVNHFIKKSRFQGVSKLTKPVSRLRLMKLGAGRYLVPPLPDT